MRIKILLFTSILLVGCNSKISKTTENIEVQYLVDEYVITQTENSYPLGNIIQMHVYNDTLYMLDQSSQLIIQADTSLSLNSIIHFPELDYENSFTPISIYVADDSIYVIDANTKGVRSLSLKSKTGTINKISDAITSRFFTYNNTFYIPCITNQNSIMILPKGVKFNDPTVIFAGRKYQFSTPKENSIKNNRYLLHDQKHYYAISDNQPFIELYDLNTNELLSEFNLSSIPIIEENIRITKSQVLKENSYYVMVEDAYIHDNAIYLLCATLGTDYQKNTIIKITLKPAMTVASIYKLPSRAYNSFCVDEAYIYAFDFISSKLVRLKIKK